MHMTHSQPSLRRMMDKGIGKTTQDQTSTSFIKMPFSRRESLDVNRCVCWYQQSAPTYPKHGLLDQAESSSWRIVTQHRARKRSDNVVASWASRSQQLRALRCRNRVCIQTWSPNRMRAVISITECAITSRVWVR